MRAAARAAAGVLLCCGLGLACMNNGDCTHGQCNGADPKRSPPKSGSCNCNGEWGGSICDEPPCQNHNNCGDHGACQNAGNGHSCQCRDGYSGPTCQLDPCNNVNCHHGTCRITGSRPWYTCDCGVGYANPGPCNTKKSCPQFLSPQHSTSCGKAKLYLESCTAKCDAGYTGGTKKQAEFTCDEQKGEMVYTGELSCDPVPCHTPSPGLPVLAPAGGKPGRGCPAGKCDPGVPFNVIIPDVCSTEDEMHYGDSGTCSMSCASGFTDQTGSGEFQCDRASDAAGNAAFDHGIWSTKVAGAQGLRCERE